MEKKFEEKFGLKVEEMSEILGGEVSTADSATMSGSCSMCSTCVYCATCIGCTPGCMICNTTAFTQVPATVMPSTFTDDGVEAPVGMGVSTNIPTNFVRF